MEKHFYTRPDTGESFTVKNQEKKNVVQEILSDEQHNDDKINMNNIFF